MSCCAIYTRTTSKDETSNAIQRLCVEGYLSRKRHEGWADSTKIYEDNGFSGDSLDRPALKSLMQDVEDNKIRAVAVEGIDRLSRDFSIFTEIAEFLDEHNVMLVTVENNFNSEHGIKNLISNLISVIRDYQESLDFPA